MRSGEMCRREGKSLTEVNAFFLQFARSLQWDPDFTYVYYIYIYIHMYTYIYTYAHVQT